MKKIILLIIVFSCGFMFAQGGKNDPLFVVDTENSDKDTIIKMIYASYTFDKNDITMDIATETIKYCEEAIVEICNYFNLDEKQYHNVFRYYLLGPSNGLASWECDGEITIYNVPDRKSSYYHETVHGVLGDSSNLWLMEGIADYLDDINTKYPLNIKGGRTLDEISKSYILKGDKYRNSFPLIFDEKESIDDATELTVQSFYLYSASFVCYLLKIMSPQEFLEVYRSTDYKSDLKRITGHSFKNLKYRWLKSIGLSIYQILVYKLL